MKLLWACAFGAWLAWLPMSSNAQDLGGVGQFISKLALSARGGTSVDLKSRVDGIMYVPFPSLTATDKSAEYACLGLGADLGAGVSGTKLHGAPLVLPMFNPVSILARLTRGAWASSHLGFTDLGNHISLGVGVKPLPVSGSGGKWVIGNQFSAAATFGFGKS